VILNIPVGAPVRILLPGLVRNHGYCSARETAGKSSSGWGGSLTPGNQVLSQTCFSSCSSMCRRIEVVEGKRYLLVLSFAVACPTIGQILN
jgi:hypothetical protein